MPDHLDQLESLGASSKTQVVELHVVDPDFSLAPSGRPARGVARCLRAAESLTEKMYHFHSAGMGSSFLAELRLAQGRVAILASPLGLPLGRQPHGRLAADVGHAQPDADRQSAGLGGGIGSLREPGFAIADAAQQADRSVAETVVSRESTERIFPARSSRGSRRPRPAAPRSRGSWASSPAAWDRRGPADDPQVLHAGIQVVPPRWAAIRRSAAENVTRGAGKAAARHVVGLQLHAHRRAARPAQAAAWDAGRPATASRSPSGSVSWQSRPSRSTANRSRRRTRFHRRDRAREPSPVEGSRPASRTSPPGRRPISSDQPGIGRLLPQRQHRSAVEHLLSVVGRQRMANRRRFSCPEERSATTTRCRCA